MAKPPPNLTAVTDNRQGRRRLYKTADERTRESRVVNFFRSPVTAFLALFFLFWLAAIPYLTVHAIPGFRPKMLDVTTTVAIADDGTFQPSFQEVKLERFFSRLQIVEIEKRITDKASAMSQRAVEARRDVLAPINELVDKSLSGMGLPGILSKDIAKVTDSELLRANLVSLHSQLTNNFGKVPPEDLWLAQQGARLLHGLHQREEEMRQKLRTEITGLEPPLSFCWLYTDCGWWVIEVVFWSFVGVHANTAIALILACRRNEYSPAEFVLLFPKIFMAPLLAFVFVALWSSGLTESKINYLNLPYFLVFAFLLGFATEVLYEKLRDLVALIVTPSATLSKERLEEASRKLPYTYQNANVRPTDLPPPQDLNDMQKQLAAVIKARLERAVVANTAMNK